MPDDRKFYRVIRACDLWYAKLPNHLENGYETEYDFRRALRNLVDYWHDREGECVDQRHGHLLLRFHDTPGGKPDEAWIPVCLLKSVPTPDYLAEDPPLHEEALTELDRALWLD